MHSFLTTGLTTLLVSFALCACLTLIILRLASRFPRLARSSSGRLHVSPTPIWGGVAIFVSFTSIASYQGLFNTRVAIALAVSASCMFLVGFLDDVWKLPPRWKLIGQILSAVTPIYLVSGHHFTVTGNRVMDVLLGLLWMIGITNAFNLLDNINGLAAGTAVLVSAFESIHLLHRGEPSAALACMAFCGSLLGFLIFNFPKGRIFMGDSGSLYIGFWLAATTMVTAHASGKHRLSSFLFPLLVMVVPICDTTLVTLTRMLKGRPVSVGGTDHLSHRLVAYGFSQKSAVLALWCSSFFSGLLAICAVLYGASALLSAVAFLVISVGISAAYLTRFELGTHTDSPQAMVPRTRFSAWLLISSRVMLDIVLMIAAYYTAYLLRFDGEISRPDMQLFVSTVAELALIKLAVLVAFGAYRPWWDYFGLRDAYRFVSASILASLSAVTYFSVVYRFNGFSRIVFAVDFLIFTLLALILRFSFRLLDDISPANHRTNVLIYGANSEGETALQLVSKRYRFRVVGFLDDDRTKKPFSIHSVPVRGGTQDLARVCEEYKVSTLLLTGSAPTEARDNLSAQCRGLGIRLLLLEVALEDLTNAVAGPSLAKLSAAPALSEEEILQPCLKALTKVASS